MKSRYRLAVSDTRALPEGHIGVPLPEYHQARTRRTSARADQAAGAVVPGETPRNIFRNSGLHDPDDEGDY